MKINYDELLEHYRIQFEGVPDPVFYYDLLPAPLMESPENWERYRFAHGLKYDITKNQASHKEPAWWNDYNDSYKQILMNFLSLLVDNNLNQHMGVIAIPSSVKGVENCVTRLIQGILDSNTYKFKQLTDLTECFVRTETKVAAHDSGNRSLADNINTLGFTNPVALHKFHALVVIDDVITSGNSFSAVEEVIRRTGFQGEIINFSFIRTMTEYGLRNYDKWNNYLKKEEWNDGRYKRQEKIEIEGIIFDLDQTLVDNQNRVDEFESKIKDVHIGMVTDTKGGQINIRDFLNHYDVYSAYEGVEDFQKQRIPFAILSNSWEKRVNLMLQKASLQKSIYPDTWKTHFYPHSNENKEWFERYQGNSNVHQIYERRTNTSWRYSFYKPKNIFTAPNHQVKRVDTNNQEMNGVQSQYRTVHFSKPSQKGVMQAKEWLVESFELSYYSRIIGVGNTPEDIIAYHEAEIESVLALWGVPNIARKYAKKNWGADYVFESFLDFSNWVNKHRPVAFIQDF